LQLILIFLVMIIFGLIGAYVLVIFLNKKRKEEKEEEAMGLKDEKLDSFNGMMPRESIFKFMEFDEIKDNMIIRKNKTQYIMILQCQGINYDLMSEEEKMAVEQGFVQFLNTLTFPIQLYVQTRSLNLRDIIDDYKTRVSDIANDIEKLDTRISAAKTKGNEKLIQRLKAEKERKMRVLEYGTDISDNVARMSLNKNVLQQKTYVIVSYFSAEFSGADNATPEELDNIAFSELYTRCQSVARSLMSSEVSSRVLDSEELAELLYVAYNRDDSELVQFSKALDAQYDALYTTGKDVIQKRKEQIEAQINEEAIELATESIVKADKYRYIDAIKKQQKVKEKALEMIEDYKDQMDEVIYEGAKREIEKADLSETEEKPKKRPGRKKKTEQ
ncbi:MAG: hypothetical protein IKF52_06310, partial [Clostridia bacterium]|nr:hypothetical protein [Clostridia bacterium]